MHFLKKKGKKTRDTHSRVQRGRQTQTSMLKVTVSDGSEAQVLIVSLGHNILFHYYFFLATAFCERAEIVSPIANFDIAELFIFFFCCFRLALDFSLLLLQIRHTLDTNH